MRKRLKITLIGVAVIIAMLTYWRYSINKEDESLMKEGDKLIAKIERYRTQNHRLPDYLEDLKLNLPDDYPLNYAKRDDDSYVVGFQIGFFKDITYRSDTKKWDK